VEKSIPGVSIYHLQTSRTGVQNTPGPMWPASNKVQYNSLLCPVHMRQTAEAV